MWGFYTQAILARVTNGGWVTCRILVSRSLSVHMASPSASVISGVAMCFRLRVPWELLFYVQDSVSV